MVFLLVYTYLYTLPPIKKELLRISLLKDRNCSHRFLLFYVRSFSRISYLIFVKVNVGSILFIISLLSQINQADGNGFGKNILLILLLALAMNDDGIIVTRNLRILTFAPNLLFNKFPLLYKTQNFWYLQ